MNQKNGAKNIWTIQKVSLDEKEKTKRIQINQRGLVDDIRILATINSDACYVDSNIVWTNNNEMIIEAVFGLALAVISPNETSTDPATMIYRGIVTGNKIIKKEENNEVDDSIHEELYQMTKDSIYKMGGLK